MRYSFARVLVFPEPAELRYMVKVLVTRIEWIIVGLDSKNDLSDYRKSKLVRIKDQIKKFLKLM